MEKFDPSHIARELEVLKLIQLTVGTGVAGGYMHLGRLVQTLFEPGKLALNLDAQGDFDFPRRIVGTNLIGKDFLADVVRGLFGLDKSITVDLRDVSSIARRAEQQPVWAISTGLTIDELQERATEVFRILGRVLADLAAICLRHFNADAVSLAGGPLQGLPDEIGDAFVERMTLYGFDATHISGLIWKITSSNTSPLLADLRRLGADTESLTPGLLKQMVEACRKSCRLSELETIKSNLKYLPIGAYELVMQALTERFANAPGFSVNFGGALNQARTDCRVVVPDGLSPTECIETSLAKYPCAVTMNQAMTAGFETCNYDTCVAIAQTLQGLSLSEGLQYVFEAAHISNGFGVLSRVYYSTFKQVRDAVVAPATCAAGNQGQPNAVGIEEVAIGCDIGGTGIKLVVLTREKGHDWMLETSGLKLPEASVRTDDMIPKGSELADVAGRLVAHLKLLVQKLKLNGSLTRVGVVFPAAIAKQTQIAGTSGTAGRFVGQTTSILDSDCSRLMRLDFLKGLKEAWSTEVDESAPQIRLANDGPASAIGAVAAAMNHPEGIADIGEPEGWFGAIGVALLVLQRTFLKTAG